jgi:sugar lactone lactonase YvrE
MPNHIHQTLALMTVFSAACGAEESDYEISSQAVVTQVLAVGPRPESVTRAWCNKLYVSLQGPTSGPGDGEVRVIENGVAVPFVSGLDEPKGLAFTGRYLVVTDLTRVWIIDETGNKRVLADASAFPFPVAFFNDAAPEQGGRAVYVTEMGGRTKIRDASGALLPLDSPLVAEIPVTSRVYRIALDGTVTEAVSPSQETLILNGVTQAKKGGRLLAAEFFYGNVTEIKLNSNEKRVIATGFRGADGIAQDHQGNIYLSSFEQGTVWKMDAEGRNVQVLLTGLGPKTTADFFLDEKAGQLIQPSTAGGTLTFLTTR